MFTEMEVKPSHMLAHLCSGSCRCGRGRSPHHKARKDTLALPPPQLWSGVSGQGVARGWPVVVGHGLSRVMPVQLGRRPISALGQGSINKRPRQHGFMPPKWPQAQGGRHLVLPWAPTVQRPAALRGVGRLWLEQLSTPPLRRQLHVEMKLHSHHSDYVPKPNVRL